MSSELPGSAKHQAPARPMVIRTNGRQVLLFAALTLVLTVLTVWGVRSWLAHSETLTFAVGDARGEEALFANRLGEMLKSTGSHLRIRIVSSPDNGKAITQFDRREADLAILRTDAKVPPRARAIAILDHDLVLLVSPGKQKISSLGDLRKKKIAVVADGEQNATFIRNLLEATGSADASRIQIVARGSTPDRLFGTEGFGAVIVIAHASSLIKDKSFEQYARRSGLTVNAIEGTKLIARKFPGISEETLPTGMLGASPALPSEDLATIGLEWMLIAQSKMSASTAGELARAIYENKALLALPGGFASRIEPASTDKDAFIVAHQGAAEYINDDTKTFVDRYSDLAYLVVAVLSVIGSIFATIYAKVTRIAPEKASELATAILTIGEKVEHADSLDTVDALQEELERILRRVVVGLRDGTISKDGLDTFKLGYEFVRDEIQMHRDYLVRQAAAERSATTDDNLVIVKKAQGA